MIERILNLWGIVKDLDLLWFHLKKDALSGFMQLLVVNALAGLSSRNVFLGKEWLINLFYRFVQGQSFGIIAFVVVQVSRESRFVNWFEGVRAVVVDQVSKGHQFFQVDLNASLASSDVLGAYVDLDDDVLDYLDDLVEAQLSPFFIELKDVVFLELVGLFADNVPVILGVVDGYYLDVVFL